MDSLDSFLNELGINAQNTESETAYDQPVRTGNGIMEQVSNPRVIAINEITLEQLENIAREALPELESFSDFNNETLADSIRETAERFRQDVEEATAPVEETYEENVPTLHEIEVVNEQSTRYSGAEWFEKMQEQKVGIIGLGGIGSWLTLFIARLNLKYIYCRDMDTVEPVNLAGQLYRHNDVGQYKVDAVRGVINDFCDSRPFLYSEATEFTINSDIRNVYNFGEVRNIMLGLDSITARRTVFNWWKNKTAGLSDTYIFIDGRLTADKWQIFAFTSKDRKAIEKYEKEWLFPQSEAQHLPCSFKQTTYLAAMIASYMCNLFVNFVAESTKPMVPYNIPFMAEFDAQTFEMKTYEC